MTTTKSRLGLWVALAFTLGGLFGMHGLAPHGVSHGAPVHADAQSTPDAHASAGVPALTDYTAHSAEMLMPSSAAGPGTGILPVPGTEILAFGGVASDGMAALCLTVLTGLVLILVLLALARRNNALIVVLPRIVPVPLPRGRDPDPPGPFVLSVCRC